MFLLKFGLAALIVGILIWRNLDTLRQVFSTFNYWYLFPALACYLSHMLVSAWRWYELAQCLHFRLTLKQALSLTMQGYFFSLVIPGGAIGGDVARVGFLARRSPAGTRFDGAVTVLVDRIIGMVALFGLTIVLLLLCLPMLLTVTFPEQPWVERFRWLLIAGLFGICLGGNLAMLALFFHRQLERVPGFARMLALGDRWSRGFVHHLIVALDVYRSHWRRLAALTLISVFFIHLMTVVAVWVITLGIPGGGINFLTLTIAVTIGNIAGLIPLTLSGIGIRDVTIEILLKAGGFASVAAAVPLLYTVVVLLGNLAGGFFFVADSGRKYGGDAS